MKSIFFIIIIFCVSCKPIDTLSVDVSGAIVIPKHYIVSTTKDDMTIDGNADELSWENASFTDNFIDIEGIITPKFNTKTKMLWDDDYLYVYAEMEEPHIWGNLRQRDTVIFYNNDFEVFINPAGDAARYGEIEINALNTVWDLYLSKPYRTGGKPDFNWNLDRLKSAVKVHGTLNNPNDLDSLWTVELAIPLKPLIALKNNPKTTPKEGEQWRINFSRVEWEYDLKDGKYVRKKEHGNYLKEHNWVWSQQKVINMHEPEKWGFLQFTKEKSSKDITFIKDEDMPIKQAAFALFRKTRSGNLKHLLEHDTGFHQGIAVTYQKGKTITAQFQKTNLGFEYTLATQNAIYSIDQNGILKSL
ncbi:MAG TPA: carbohydrate-binding family 9-like protein [Flavobacteriaceae bacterium]